MTIEIDYSNNVGGPKFICQECKKRKPLEGRKLWKKSVPGIFVCATCAPPEVEAEPDIPEVRRIRSAGLKASPDVLKAVQGMHPLQAALHGVTPRKTFAEAPWKQKRRKPND